MSIQQKSQSLKCTEKKLIISIFFILSLERWEKYQEERVCPHFVQIEKNLFIFHHAKIRDTDNKKIHNTG